MFGSTYRMLSEFNELRNLALLKRNKAIDEAHAACAETLARIAELEQDLVGRAPNKEPTVAACIDSAIPPDRTFTAPELLAAVQIKVPGRSWRSRSIDERISVLRERGLLHRVRRSRAGMPAVYSRVGVEVEPLPFDGMAMRDAMVAVLGDKAMHPTELAVAMVEAGYPSAMKPQRLANTVGAILRRERERFKRVGEKWWLV